ncbi:hypothetical protein GCM10027265_18190 [Jatrophihabitans fulvus]
MPAVLDAMTEVRVRKLTYLSDRALADIGEAVFRLERDRAEGILIEAGTALGGSAIVMAAAKEPGRPLFLHDMFGMIPPPGEHDGADVHERYEKIRSGQSKGLGGETYYGYRDDLRGEVEKSLTECGFPPAANAVELVQGLFQDTIGGDDPVALAHLDGDWYESTMVCLERIAPRVVKGGRLVIDDYAAWSGCRTAVDEYLARPEGKRFTPVQHGRLHLVRE